MRADQQAVEKQPARLFESGERDGILADRKG